MTTRCLFTVKNKLIYKNSILFKFANAKDPYDFILLHVPLHAVLFLCDLEFTRTDPKVPDVLTLCTLGSRISSHQSLPGYRGGGEERTGNILLQQIVGILLHKH